MYTQPPYGKNAYLVFLLPCTLNSAKLVPVIHHVHLPPPVIHPLHHSIENLSWDPLTLGDFLGCTRLHPYDVYAVVAKLGSGYFTKGTYVPHCHTRYFQPHPVHSYYIFPYSDPAPTNG